MFKSIKNVLSNTSEKISSGIASLFNKKIVDEKTLEELRNCLISADIGVKKTDELIQQIRKVSKDATIKDIKLLIRENILTIFKSQPNSFKINTKPFVILVSGINGNGKTTTIGKLAKFYKDHNYKVKVGASDTYRAAAIEQLEAWCRLVEVPLIKGVNNADPASVAYQTVESAIKENDDIVLIDTAGRLHNRDDLMSELEKINRVIKKLIPDAPHQSLLVIDATTGQIAQQQADIFIKRINTTGIIVTKMDGTAKGGVIVNIVEQFKLPIFFLGYGEKVDDLNIFDPEEYTQGLIGI